ncbi:MAG TPA: IS110 family transposase [Alphaproteobacteria bacterium]|nr:IS110 family transposase [Alphaproteobacteria bacterium]
MSKGITSGLTIGLDLGDRFSEGRVLDESGEVVEAFRVRTMEPALRARLSSFPPSRVVLEVGTHSPWVSRTVTSLGHEAIVANPRRVRLIAENDSKSDGVDAELLARLGRVDPSLLKPIVHRGEVAQRDRILIQTRDGFVRARTQLINEVRGFAKALGTRAPSCSTEAFAKRVRETLPRDLFPGLKTLLETIEQLTKTIRRMDGEIERLCEKRYPETALLRQVRGVGAITALYFVLTLEDPGRFAKSRSVGAYVGLRPKQRDSGEQSPQLRITKAGDRLLRSLLVRCAHYILGPFGPDTDLRRAGLRMAERGGSAAKKRAIVATARRLAVLLHRLWLAAEVYEPLRSEASKAA